MKEKTNKTDVGVVMARFQCHEIHQGHRDLLDTVISKHSRVIVFLGVSPIRNTMANPLDFKHREYMIKAEYPNVEVYYQDDNRSDEVWSKNLDKQLSKWLNPGQTATLYGSRDSFISHYSGKFPTCELESEIIISASQIRKEIINNYVPSKDFRAGLIAATGLHYPLAQQTVDIAIINDADEVLLAKKPGESLWRFVGGYSDARSQSLEEDAKREVMEETGVEVSEPVYIGSTIINDWRYRGLKDKIKTAFFVAKYIFGKPEGADDVELVKWFKFSELTDEKNEVIIEEHRVLKTMFIEKVIKPTERLNAKI